MKKYERLKGEIRRKMAGVLAILMVVSLCAPSFSVLSVYAQESVKKNGVDASDMAQVSTPSVADPEEDYESGWFGDDLDFEEESEQEMWLRMSVEEQLAYMAEHTPDGGAFHAGSYPGGGIASDSNASPSDAYASPGNAGRRNRMLQRANNMLKPGEELEPDKAELQGLKIYQTKTGTPDFDADNSAGNDSGENNAIVRSFDNIIYTLTYTMGLKGTPEVSYYTSGDVYVKFVLPGVTMEEATFDVESMSWVVEPVLKEVRNASTGKTDVVLTGKRHVVSGSFVNAIPGAGTLSVIVSVRGMKNGSTIRPEFSAWMDGNNEVTESKSVSSKQVTVSARPALNVALNIGSPLCSYEVDGSGNWKGVIDAFTGIVEYKNANPNLGCKGAEVLDGSPITFDLTYSVSAYEQSTTNPIAVGAPEIYGNQVTWVTGSETVGITYLQPGKYRITISNYKVPSLSGGSGLITGFGWKTSVGIVNLNANKGYYMYDVTLNDDNLHAVSVSGVQVSEQTDKLDDARTANIPVYPYGEYAKFSYPRYCDDAGNLGGPMPSPYAGGNAVSVGGQEIFLMSWTSVYGIMGHTQAGFDHLIKFDDKAFEPTGETVIELGNVSSGTPIDTILWAAKPDGTGWRNDAEMEDTRIANLDYYASLSALKAANKTCVGVMWENREAVLAHAPGGNIYDMDSRFSVKVKVKHDSSIVGKVSQYVNEAVCWRKAAGAPKAGNTYLNKQSMAGYAVQNANTYFIENTLSYSAAYKKSEYNADGSLVAGTHNGHNLGQSVRISGESAKIKKFIAQTNEDGSPKKSFDIGAGQRTADYKLTPRVEGLPSATKTDIVITDTLPDGLTYDSEFGVVQGGTYVMEDYASGAGHLDGGVKIQDVTVTDTQSNGTELIIRLKDVPVNEELPPLYYRTMIGDGLANGSSLVNTASITSTTDLRSISADNENYANETISIIRQGDIRLAKMVDQSFSNQNESFTYTVFMSNIGNTVFHEAKFLDILPYNGDGRGTSMNGAYTVGQVTMNIKPAGLLSLYISTSEQARNQTIGNLDLSTSMWQKVNGIGGVYNVPSDTKAIALYGDMDAESLTQLMYTIKTSNNEVKDLYGNNAYADSIELPAPIETPIVQTMVVGRELSGTAWLDENKNGIRDTGEQLLEGVLVSLKDQNGNPVTDVKGNTVASVQTDQDGNYKFENLKHDTYQVVFTSGNKTTIGSFTVTEKNVGADKTKDSDAVGTTQDGVLTKAVISGITFDNPDDTEPLKKIEHMDAGFKFIPDSHKNASPASGSTVTRGDTITYTIDYTNHSGKSTSLTVTDKIPEGTSYVEDSAITVGGSIKGVLTDGELKWSNIPVDNKVKVTVQFSVKVVEGDKIENKAGVDPKNDPHFETNTTTHYVKPTYAKIDNQTQNNWGGSVSLGQVTNRDKVDWTKQKTDFGITPDKSWVTEKVTVKLYENGKDKLPTGTLDIPVKENDGSLDITGLKNRFPDAKTVVQADGTVSLELGTLPYDVEVDVMFGFRPEAKKKADPIEGTEVRPGDQIIYSIEYKNHTGEATHVTVKDEIPEGTVYVEDSAMTEDGTIKGVLANGELTWSDIPVEDEASVTVKFTVKIIKGTEIENTGNVDPDNAPSFDTNTVKHPIGATWSKIDNQTQENWGGSVSLGGVTNRDEVDWTKQGTSFGITPDEWWATEKVTVKLYEDGKDNPLTGTVEIPVKEDGSLDITELLHHFPDAETTLLADGAVTLELGALSYDTEVDVVFGFRPDAGKEANPTSGTQVKPGDLIIYTVKYTNHTGEATQVTVKDIIPEGTTYVENSAVTVGGTIDGVLQDGELIWSNIPIGKDASVAVKFTVKVIEGTEIENEAGIEPKNAPKFKTNKVTHPLEDTWSKIDNQTQNNWGGSVSLGQVIDRDEVDWTIQGTSFGITPDEWWTTEKVTVKLYEDGKDNPSTGTVEIPVKEDGSLDITGLLDRFPDAETTPLADGAVSLKLGTLPYDTEVDVVFGFRPDAKKKADPVEGTEVRPGDLITYTVEYTNHTGEATQVTVKDIIPEGTAYVEDSAMTEDGTIKGVLADGEVTWSGIPVEDEASVTVKFTVKVIKGTEIKNTAGVYPENAPSFDTNTVKHPIGDTWSKIDNQTQNNWGGSVSLDQVSDRDKVDWTKQGTSFGITPDNRWVTEKVTVKLYEDGKDNPSTGTLEIPVKEDGSLDITGLLDRFPDAETTLLADGAVSLELGTLPYDTEVDVVFGFRPDMEKKANPASGTQVRPGDLITYTVEYTNHTGEATHVMIKDIIPEGTAYVEDSAVTEDGTIKGVLTDGELIWSDIPVEDEASVTVKFTVKVIKGTEIKNSAGVYPENAPSFDTNTVTNPVSDTWSKIDNQTQNNWGGIVSLDQVSDRDKVDWTKQGTSFGITPDYRWVTEKVTVKLYEDGKDNPSTETLEIPVKEDGSLDITGLLDRFPDAETALLGDGAVSLELGTLPYDTEVDVVFGFRPDMEKKADPASGTEVYWGQEITYTVSYTNHTGENTAVTIKDKIPEGTVYVEDSAVTVDGTIKGVLKDGELIWSDIPVADEASVTVKFTVKVVNGDTIENTAEVLPDNTPSFNTNTTGHPIKATYGMIDNQTAGNKGGSVMIGTVTDTDKVDWTKFGTDFGIKPEDRWVISKVEVKLYGNGKDNPSTETLEIPVKEDGSLDITELKKHFPNAETKINEDGVIRLQLGSQPMDVEVDVVFKPTIYIENATPNHNGGTVWIPGYTEPSRENGGKPQPSENTGWEPDDSWFVRWQDVTINGQNVTYNYDLQAQEKTVVVEIDGIIYAGKVVMEDGQVTVVFPNLDIPLDVAVRFRPYTSGGDIGGGGGTPGTSPKSPVLPVLPEEVASKPQEEPAPQEDPTIDPLPKTGDVSGMGWLGINIAGLLMGIMYLCGMKKKEDE